MIRWGADAISSGAALAVQRAGICGGKYSYSYTKLTLISMTGAIDPHFACVA
jgi:hypothetical protein